MLAYNDEYDIMDPFYGVDDINNKNIRCVGNPDLNEKRTLINIIEYYFKGI